LAEQTAHRVGAAVRIGSDWWRHLGGETADLEVWAALVRACIHPGTADDPGTTYELPQLASIVSTASVPEDYNVSVLQRSQLPWLFLVAWHSADQLLD